MHLFETLVEFVSGCGVYVFELICIGVMFWGGVKSLVMLLRRKERITLTLSRYMNIALLFKLGAEIMRLAYVRTLAELALVAGIVVIHGAISFLIQWERKREEQHEAEKAARDRPEEDIYI